MKAPHQGHDFEITTTWTGNKGGGTSSYRSYGREHEIGGKPKACAIAGSSAPAFRGDAARYNPEELQIAALSACHMLWFLHLCAQAGVVVTEYRDHATGTVDVREDGSGRFTQVVLRPAIRLAQPTPQDQIAQLHEKAHGLCFIAASVNFPVLCRPASL